jgi:CheY-like chemotaxis protein
VLLITLPHSRNGRGRVYVTNWRGIEWGWWRSGRPDWIKALNTHDLPAYVSSDHLKGVRILLVEDSWHIGIALKGLLHDWGADVVGPAATTAEADRLLCEHVPDVALVDLILRGGERAHALIDRLHDRGIRVIVASGYGFLPLSSGKAAAVLQKPFSETQLLATLSPVIGQRLSSTAPAVGCAPPISRRMTDGTPFEPTIEPTKAVNL